MVSWKPVVKSLVKENYICYSVGCFSFRLSGSKGEISVLGKLITRKPVSKMIKKYKRENDKWLSCSWLDKMLSLSLKLRTNWYKGKGEKGRSKRCSEAVQKCRRIYADMPCLWQYCWWNVINWGCKLNLCGIKPQNWLRWELKPTEQ